MKVSYILIITLVFYIFDSGVCFVRDFDQVDREVEECKVNAGISQDDIDNINATERSEDQNCFLACLLNKLEHTNSDGDLLSSSFREWLLEFLSSNAAEEIGPYCEDRVKKAEGQCNKADELFKCLNDAGLLI